MADGKLRRIDVWEMRCWFKHKRFLERVQARELKENVVRSKPASPESKQPTGTMSEIVRFIDLESDSEVAEVHRFRLPNNKLAASGKVDPKYLVVDGIEFRRYLGPYESKRDPCVLFPPYPFGGLRRVYGLFRRMCCCLLGPENDGKLAAIMTPALRWVLSSWDIPNSC
jgi:hypothetical protein